MDGNATVNRTEEDLGVTHPLERRQLYVFAFMVPVSALLAILIVSGNGLVIAAFKHNPRLRRRGFTLLVSLAFSDFLVGIVSLPLWICIVSLKTVAGPFYLFFISFDIFSALTSVLHLVLVSVDRFIAVSKPYRYESFSPHAYNAAIAFCWVFSAFLAAAFPLQQKYDLKEVYVPAMVILGFVVPLVVITCTYIGIFKIAKQLTDRLPRASIPNNEAKAKKSRMRTERTTAITLAIITGLFFGAWLPFFALNITATFFVSALPSGSAQMWLVDFVKWMHYTNSAVNPFVYAFRDAAMRRTFVRLGSSRFGRPGASACCRRRANNWGSRRSHRSKPSETQVWFSWAGSE